MCQHNLPCSIVYAHCLLPGRAFASLYVLLFLEKEAEIGGRASIMNEKKFSNQLMFLKAKEKTQSNHEVLGLWQRSLRLHDVIDF